MVEFDAWFLAFLHHNPWTLIPGVVYIGWIINRMIDLHNSPRYVEDEEYHS